MSQTPAPSTASPATSPHDRLAETYRTGLARVTAQAIAPLLDAVAAGPGMRLLDVGCGPGDLIAAAAGRGAQAAGTDLAPGMVSVASRLYPNLDFRVAAADAQPFADASFDAITCSFGVGQFPDAEAFARECARLLRSDGRAAITWWQGYDRNRINGLFYQVLVELGVTQPPADAYGNADNLAALLKTAGCQDVTIQDVSFLHPVAGLDAYWQLAMGSFGRIAKLYDAQDQAMQERIRSAVETALRAHVTADGMAIPVAFRIAAGTRAA